MIRILIGCLLALFRGRNDLLRRYHEHSIEILALRQQLAVFHRIHPRPRLNAGDRVFWLVLRRLRPRWSDALILVKPETVVRWHKEGFRLYWRLRSRRRRRPGRPRVSTFIQRIIRQMATENGWRAPRIHGELLKLGFLVSERTVSRCLPRLPGDPDAVKRWIAFLRNHADAIAAMDFLTVPTATFRNLYVWFVILHGSRRVVHFNVTEHPHPEWVRRQLIESFAFENPPPRFLISDRDSTFDEHVTACLESFGTERLRTSYRSPWQNPIAERFVGSLRRELLDHVVVFNENHLRRLIGEYLSYYHEDRTHCGLGKETPARRQVQKRPSPSARVVSLARVGGLHHRYEWRDAA